MSQSHEDIVREAKDRLKAALEWEDQARQRARADYKFAHGDSDNGFQWADELANTRRLQQRPVLTINKVRQHVLQIINDARQNKVEVRINPTGDGATYESAQIMQDVVRHIEYQSQADDVYINAVGHQVTAGIGYWRVLSEYVSDKSFDQEIYLRRIKDPNMVVLDPDINEFDGSDARFGFVYEDIPDKLFDKRYPAYKDKAPHAALAVGNDMDVPKDHTRICEYFRRTEKKDRLYALPDGKKVLRSEVGDEVASQLNKDESIQNRDILTSSVEWFLIIGNEIAEKRKWPGKYIPIVRVVGEETIIDGTLDRKGHVRALKDAQRMYNYWSSAAVEFGALQSKIPWVIPVESVEGVEQYWRVANTTNFAYLPYKATREDGSVLPPPQRAQPPVAAPAFIAGMQTAAGELMMASGQYQAQMGEESNERTGIAIQERQRQGDNATYHYIDNLASAIRYTGRILIDLIPSVYDTERIMQIVQENGDQVTVAINPQMEQASAEQQQGEAIIRMLNPNVGRYEVEAGVGPQFSTRRQEAFNALMQLAVGSPAIMDKAGDLVMRVADFPMSEDLAERLKPVGLDPQMQALQQQLQQLQTANTTLVQQLASKQNLLQEREQQKDIDVYKAETERMNAVAKIDPVSLIPIVRQLVAEAMQTTLGSVVQTTRESLVPPDQPIPGQQLNGQTGPGPSPGQPQQ